MDRCRFVSFGVGCMSVVCRFVYGFAEGFSYRMVTRYGRKSCDENGLCIIHNERAGGTGLAGGMVGMKRHFHGDARNLSVTSTSNGS